MSDLMFVCRQCSKKLVIDEAGAGATISCPDCAMKNVVPPSEMRCHCPACNTWYGVCASLEGDSIECPHCDTSFIIQDQTSAESKMSGGRCRECGATMEAGAVFCVKCGVNQKTGLRLKAEGARSEGPRVREAEGPGAGVNPVLERLAHPQRRQSSFAERSLPAIKAIALVSCSVAAVMAALHYSRPWRGSKESVPVMAANVGVSAVESSAVSSADAPPAGVAMTEHARPETPRSIPPGIREVIGVLDSMKVNPGDLAAGGKLLSYIGCIVETNETRSIVAGLKALHALREVGLGRSEGGLAACASVQGNYADTEFAAAVQRGSLHAPCGKCAGSGEMSQPCTVCAKDGVCSSCSGRGSRQVVKSAPLAAATPMSRGGVRRMQDAPAKITVTTGCAVCQGSGKCTACSGAGHLSVTCPDCRKSGMVVSKAKVRLHYDAAISNTIQHLMKFAESGNDLVLTAKGEPAGFTASPAEQPGQQEPQTQPRPIVTPPPERDLAIHYASQLVKLVDETFVPLTSPAPEGAGLTDFMHECSLKTGGEEKVAAASVKLCQHLREVRRERERRVQQYQGTDKKNYAGLAPSRTYSRRCSHWGGYYGLCDACRLRLEQQQAEQKKAEDQASERKNFYLTAIISNWGTYEAAERARCDRELEAVRAMEMASRKALAPPSGGEVMASQP